MALPLHHVEARVLRLTSLLRHPPRLHSLRCLYSTTTTTTTTPPPPLLTKLRTDLKTALRSKDAPRLAVTRALLAEIANASKTPHPITTDLQFLSLLRKRIASAEGAADEFGAAGRADLVAREREQVAVLEGYAGEVETVGEGEVRGVVEGVVEGLRGEGVGSGGGKKVAMGEVLKRVLGPGGVLEGRAVERREVVRVVREVLGA